MLAHAYYPVAPRLRYCVSEGRLVSYFSPRKPLRLRIVLPPLGVLIIIAVAAAIAAAVVPGALW